MIFSQVSLYFLGTWRKIKTTNNNRRQKIKKPLQSARSVFFTKICFRAVYNFYSDRFFNALFIAVEKKINK